MSVSEALTLLGGVATRQQLVELTSRAEVDAALREGRVVAEARGRYVSPAADDARRAGARLSGAVGLLSAALAHGWAVKLEPTQPQVVLPRNRKLAAGQADGVEVLRADLDDDDVVAGVTSPDRTLLDCGRRLPLDEALAVFDSALRSGFSHVRLVALMRDARGPRARQMRRLAWMADARAANPFESVLRYLALQVSGLTVRPQVPVYAARFLGRPDLVDEALKIIVEADSFEWHGNRAALVKDARRYNWFVAHGWLVLRFAWEDVMHDPDYVIEVLSAVVAERTYLADGTGRPA